MFEKLKSFDESTIQLRLLFGSVWDLFKNVLLYHTQPHTKKPTKQEELQCNAKTMSKRDEQILNQI